MNVPQRSTSTRSPVLAILASLVAGVVLAVALLLGPASGGSEPMITGSVLFAFGLGWGLMALLSTRYSAQPQTWMMVPALFLGIIGLGLIVFQPGPAAMDLLSWIWPPALAVLAVWMFMQVRRNLHGRGRWLVVPVIATLLLIAVGGAFATVSAATGRTAQSASGQMIDVGGHRLYIECHGSGSPVVLLQVGLGGTAADWGRIAPTVADSTTVCAYDRAGHGLSEEAAGPQDGIAIATDLHTLLERAGVHGPYVLVGHSSGGPYVRVFAARYPDEVAGMVLLDAQPADAFTALPDYPSLLRPVPDRLDTGAITGPHRPWVPLRIADRSVRHPGGSKPARRGHRTARRPAAGAGADDARCPTTRRRLGRIRPAGGLACRPGSTG